MKCIALTGIAPAIISEIKHGKPRTLELQSAHNLITLTEAKPGECIFMTSVDLDDLSPGDSGILVQVISLTINMKRLVEFINPLYYEERERMSARIQVKYTDSTLAKSVEGKGWGEATIVEVVKASCYHAG
ncbi:MAG: DUF473 domain-containing protein [Methanomicrobiales archaeon]|nr:DUF473 domain-containing protein [Methanomicrobiales archaeon]